MRMQGPAAKRSRPGDACKGQKHERSETQEVRHGERWQMIFRSSQLVRLFPRDVGQFAECTSSPNASLARNHIAHAWRASRSLRATRKARSSTRGTSAQCGNGKTHEVLLADNDHAYRWCWCSRNRMRGDPVLDRKCDAIRFCVRPHQLGQSTEQARRLKETTRSQIKTMLETTRNQIKTSCEHAPRHGRK